MSTNNSNLTFKPNALARNRHFQTVYSSLHKCASPNLLAASQEIILDTGDGVRLQGFYSPQPAGNPKGLILLLHGWLGYANSSYITATGEYLHRRGYAIFRLNFRDHGDTLNLNPDVFRSDRLDEVFNATCQIALLEPDQPMHIVGVSLGANFALRLAWRHSQTPVSNNLGHVISICPVIDPYNATMALDNKPAYLYYFRRKWRQVMQEKQTLFPQLHNFTAEINCKTCMAMTETFMQNNGPYPDAITYFKHYTITPDMMQTLNTPVTIITAADDPIIPIVDFHPFRNLSPHLHVSIQPYGGHVGFIDIFPYRHWISKAASIILENKEKEGGF